MILVHFDRCSVNVLIVVEFLLSVIEISNCKYVYPIGNVLRRHVGN